MSKVLRKLVEASESASLPNSVRALVLAIILELDTIGLASTHYKREPKVDRRLVT